MAETIQLIINGKHYEAMKGQTILQAAQLAATYSKGRQADKVPMDYTLRKYVKKPGGAKPGFVIYTHQQTLYVSPDEKLAQRLMKN